MTGQRIRRLKAKILASRSRLMATHPFFSLLLMYMRFIAVPDMKKMSTDGKNIYFSPDFLDKLYWYEVDFILCHQILHILYGHIFRGELVKNDNYHLACDIKVNDFLDKIGFPDRNYSHLGCLKTTIPGTELDVFTLSAEDIYYLLPYSLYSLEEKDRSRHLADSDFFWDSRYFSTDKHTVIIDFPELEPLLNEKRSGGGAFGEGDGDGQSLKLIWAERAAAAAKLSHFSPEDYSDEISELMERVTSKIKKAQSDWKHILNSFIQERVCDYSFSPPDRRYSESGFFLPDFNEKEFVPCEVLFMVDTSGSVNEEELTLAYSEIAGAIEQFGGKLSGKLGFFDTEVKSALPFESVEELLKIVPYGGGGTDFGAVFDYIRNNSHNELPACVVIFTDGNGPYPDESAAMGIPVLWLINNSYMTPPWGKTARVIP